ncbi:PAS domain-containing protein [Halorientalis sp.]|jgi:PAS domain S-box-containing protein|uniref:PAS domain-containing protein n=1 Tax=Halorientalis sp. TaxID=1931229 RepID=UPI00261051E9|nr:PAS domain-containing protein [Halorientalis sp.]
MDYGEITAEVGDTRVFAQILDRFPECVMITAGPEHDKPEEEILFVNKHFEQMTGYGKEEALGETPKMLQGEETSEQVMNKLTENLSEDGHFVGETTNYRKSGEPYQVRWSVDALESDEDSGVTHWVSIQRDTSDDALTSGFR